MEGNQHFHTNIVDSLGDPIASMDMARTLRRVADLIESKIVEAVNWHCLQIQLGIDAEARGETLEPPSEEDRQAALKYRADGQMARVSQMLYQMSYENAAKAIIKLKGAEPRNIHDLQTLFDQAGIVLPEGIDMQHLSLLSRMNQLGRYTLTTRNEYSTSWAAQYRERRAEIDSAIAQAWIGNRGAYRMADLTDIDEV